MIKSSTIFTLVGDSWNVMLIMADRSSFRGFQMVLMDAIDA